MNVGNLKLNAVILWIAFGFTHSATWGGEVTAQVTVVGKLFNTSSRQHIQANFSGSGVHQSSGLSGTVNGGVSSTAGMRSPQGNVLGTYTVNVRANVNAEGISTSRSIVTSVNVRRKVITVRGLGRIKLSRPVRLNKKGRQTLRGSGIITIQTPV